MSIEISPYKQIENQEFDLIEEIIIENELFEKTKFRDNQITFIFRNCKFKTLFIKNNSDIDFKDISILFSYCEIEKIYVKKELGIVNITFKPTGLFLLLNDGERDKPSQAASAGGLGPLNPSTNPLGGNGLKSTSAHQIDSILEKNPYGLV